MQRLCPHCSKRSIPASSLIISDTHCAQCQRCVGVHWLFRWVFFAVTLAATVALGFIVLVAQGIYAAVLMVSLPIGAIGYIKASISPLVVRREDPPMSVPPHHLP